MAEEEKTKEEIAQEEAQAKFEAAARMLDQTAHGGMIVMGAPTVIIGG